ncbi:YbaB/EbfC family DNA-binding protein [Nocardia sp. NPDC052566]|uniref:YbaB/EbfC family DNA-binding protein n=1 Tax=Nocardia sp. NPDC052566 TaxID=3364330 RepID=UPI0037C92887
MTDDTAQPDLAAMAELERQRLLHTATALVRDKRIQVTVNSDGVLIETRFADDIGDLSYDEIADAVVDAVRTAATEVIRKGRDLMWPLLERDTEVPITTDFFPGGISGEPVVLTPTSQDLPASLRVKDDESDDVPLADGSRSPGGFSIVRDGSW